MPLTTVTRGLVTTVTAVATDRAGNRSASSVTWRRPVVRVVGALRVAPDGSYVVRRGATYRLVAMLAGSPAPRVLGPVRQGRRFDTPGVRMQRGAVVGGLTTWGRAITVTGPGRDLKVAVQVGGRRIVVDLRVG